MEQELFDILAKKYERNELSGDERKIFEEYLRRLGEQDPKDLSAAQLAEIKGATLQRIREQMEGERAPVIPLYRRSVFKIAAAAIIIAIGIGSYLWFTNKEEKHPVASAPRHDILPGRDGAILTLANGKEIVLDNAANGKITDAAIKQGNEISYKGSADETPEWNTMTTPRGRQFSLVLADGTKVWLNAGSSITYPTAFRGNTREVKITGEAYFEVTQNTKQPFHVKKGETDITVLGTNFNVNTYEDEDALKVTLVDGSVKVSNKQNSAILKPSEQAIINPANLQIQKILIQTDEVTAWKNGLFQFNDTDIRTVMRQISRWYDVEVSYPKGVPKDQYWGAIRRDESLANVFKTLQESGAHFQIEGRKVIVLP